MEGEEAHEKDGKPCPMTTSHTMFYGSSPTMAPPSKNRLKRQSRIFSQVLYRTLSYKDRSSASASPAASEDDPAELSTQLSAPGVLKIFGGNICAGTNYKSVLATGSSGARELVKEALERYGLSQRSAGQYALCDVIGRFEGPEKRWQTEGLRVLGDHEKPLLIQDLWKPREGFSRRLELRKRAEVEEMAARDVDTTTAGQERTRELAEKQSQHHDPATLSCFTITDLLPDLQHILFWMANAIEVLYFVQQKSPTYIQSMEEELDVKGSKESLFSSTITASEEAMTVLEEVIMYTFQQCVYYISKCLYVSLPALLECNPFQNECRESWRAVPPLPEELRRVVLIYQATLDLLRQYEVHPEITSQMFAYLFFFSNTLLFNQLLDKGSSLSCFHWSQGVKLRACVRLLLEWLRGAGFEQLAQQFFAKLASVANLLAMPGSQLVQMTWSSLRAEFPALSPAQLHRVLSQCQEVMDLGCITAWQPGEEESPATFQPDEVLESFDNHPPIILPSGGFKVDLEVETLDDNIYRHLLYIRHFLWSLQSKSPHSSEGPGLAPPKKEACTTPDVLEVSESPVRTCTITQEDYCALGGCAEPQGSPPLLLATNGCPCEHPAGEPQLQEKLKQLQLGRGLAPKAGMAPPASSCLLTPPTTPLPFDSGSPESPQGTSKGLQDPRRNGMNSTKGSTPEGCSPTPYDYPTPESSSRSSATDDFCYVFVVELERGPIGLGMGLIDGVHTSLCSPGIYIRTLIEDSPAATDGRLSIGDRILAVNGTSLIGADYQSAVDLIRSGGKKLRFLVAKSDMEIAKKISSSSSSS
ncbi:PREDICTED: ras-associating and dilute domain-containing protein [Chaetura pelagica]|uniref:ras-associating and dilute domain-containing protein n=1 Tax=Chaetura pelagica TaxID=8897 RepID=UPI000523C808|nr:PREDICTED: ras-associating and dilute domain-containing protein [Chaetura pelagica]